VRSLSPVSCRLILWSFTRYDRNVHDGDFVPGG
jgi:hypothetical protein